MGGSTSISVKTTEIKALQTQCENSIADFKKQVKKQTKYKPIKEEKKIDVYSSTLIDYKKHIEEIFSTNSWGKVGDLAKQSIMGIFSIMTQITEGQSKTTSGKYVYVDKFGSGVSINEIYWKIGIRSINGQTYAQKQTQNLYYYIYQSFPISLPQDITTTYLKGVLASTTLDEKQQVDAFGLLACQILQICSLDPLEIDRIKLINDQITRLMKQGKFKEAFQLQEKMWQTYPSTKPSKKI